MDRFSSSLYPPPSHFLEKRDPIVDAVISSFLTRSKVGIQKYGTTLADNPLPPGAWIQHAQEELMDAILYLEKLKSEIQK